MTPARMQALRELIDSPDYDSEYGDLGPDVIYLIEEVERLREALEGLKDDPKVRLGAFEATRITSVAALNARIDRILNPGAEEREE